MASLQHLQDRDFHTNAQHTFTNEQHFTRRKMKWAQKQRSTPTPLLVIQQTSHQLRHSIDWVCVHEYWSIIHHHAHRLIWPLDAAVHSCNERTRWKSVPYPGWFGNVDWQLYSVQETDNELKANHMSEPARLIDSWEIFITQSTTKAKHSSPNCKPQSGSQFWTYHNE